MKIRKYRFSLSFILSYDHSKDVFAQIINEHLKCSTLMETPATPSMNINGLNKIGRDQKESDDEQNFYSTPTSRIFTSG